MDALPVCFNDMFADGQSQAGTASVAAAGGIGTVKAFENTYQMFFFNANAVVADLYQYMLVVGMIYTGHNTAVLFAVFGGILYQIDQHLFYFFLIGKYSDGR